MGKKVTHKDIKKVDFKGVRNTQKTSPSQRRAVRLAKQAFTLQQEIEEAKGLYAQMDEITGELLNDRISEVIFTQDGVRYVLEVVDNFAEKNTVFRSAAVRHYEIKIEELEEE